MKNLFHLIDNQLLSFDTIDNPDWHLISDAKELGTFLHSQSWHDLRAERSLIATEATEKERLLWDKEIKAIIRERLQEVGYEKYLDLISADMQNCHLNIKHILKHPLWNAIFKAYKKGSFPCGWLGNYPEGKLVVFHPNTDDSL